MKAQRVWIDPELLAQWDAEDRQSASAPGAGAPRD
jgi:hypothetical protein